jgi:hypothetical protein
MRVAGPRRPADGQCRRDQRGYECRCSDQHPTQPHSGQVDDRLVDQRDNNGAQLSRRVHERPAGAPPVCWQGAAGEHTSLKPWGRAVSDGSSEYGLLYSTTKSFLEEALVTTAEAAGLFAERRVGNVRARRRTRI